MGLAGAGGAVLATGLGAAGFFALAGVFTAGGFGDGRLEDKGAGFLTAGRAFERTAGAAALAFFGDGRLTLRRSFAMFLLLRRSRDAGRLNPEGDLMARSSGLSRPPFAGHETVPLVALR
jgi:hypothetical protein